MSVHSQMSPCGQVVTLLNCCRALTEALDKSKKKYQAKIRRLEQQMLGLLGPAPDTLSSLHSRGSGHRGQDIS